MYLTVILVPGLTLTQHYDFMHDELYPWQTILGLQYQLNGPAMYMQVDEGEEAQMLPTLHMLKKDFASDPLVQSVELVEVGYPEGPFWNPFERLFSSGS